MTPDQLGGIAGQKSERQAVQLAQQRDAAAALAREYDVLAPLEIDPASDDEDDAEDEEGRQKDAAELAHSSSPATAASARPLVRRQPAEVLSSSSQPKRTCFDVVALRKLPIGARGARAIGYSLWLGQQPQSGLGLCRRRPAAPAAKSGVCAEG